MIYECKRSDGLVNLVFFGAQQIKKERTHSSSFN